MERTVVSTGRSRTDPGTARFVSYSPGRRLSLRGAEAVCTRLGAASRATNLHPHQFRHTAGPIVQDELGDPLLTADYRGHHGLRSLQGLHGVCPKPPRRSLAMVTG